jgi:phosphopantetheine adenylyltransferase
MELHLDAAHTALLRELVERTWRNLRYDIILRGIRSKQTLDHERALRTILDRLGGEVSDRSA